MTKKVTVLLLFAALVFTAGACSSIASAYMESTTTSGAETRLVESTVTEVDQQQSVEAAPTPEQKERTWFNLHEELARTAMLIAPHLCHAFDPEW